jgi:phosphopantothenoylcysteine decarboxylase/phosphopantothenate--cysteine ligase
MAAALAAAARDRGGEVIVVSGPSNTPLPWGIKVLNVNTAQEMFKAMTSLFDKTDVCIMAAAVSDFRPAKRVNGKIHRSDSKSLSLDLVANQDILKTLGSRKKKQFLAGFALEEDDNVQNAIKKMKQKNCDLMIHNRVDASLGRNDACVRIISRDKKPEVVPCAGKASVAQRILDAIAERMGLTNGSRTR